MNNPPKTPAIRGSTAASSSQAANDEECIVLWLHGTSPNTRAAYVHDVRCFLTFARKSLRDVMVRDVQQFMDSLKTAAATKDRVLSAIKSFSAFAHRIDYISVDMAKVVRRPKLRRRLAERFLSEEEVDRIIEQESNPRDRLILVTLYVTGLRVSELCGLVWGDVLRRGANGAQIIVSGKGSKMRTVNIPESLWVDLQSLRNDRPYEAAVFASRNGKGHLSRCQVLRIVRRAACRAKVRGNVSPHWFRHSHATHAINRGAPLHLVKDTLGHSSLAVTGMYLHTQPDESSALYLDR